MVGKRFHYQFNISGEFEGDIYVRSPNKNSAEKLVQSSIVSSLRQLGILIDKQQVQVGKVLSESKGKEHTWNDTETTEPVVTEEEKETKKAEKKKAKAEVKKRKPKKNSKEFEFVRFKNNGRWCMVSPESDLLTACEKEIPENVFMKTKDVDGFPKPGRSCRVCRKTLRREMGK